MTKSEKKILRKIRRWLGSNYDSYDFWFTYDGDVAIGWEGGFSLPKDLEFRNEYTVRPGKRVMKNW